MFALHGRVRPYNKYLGWELRQHPLADPARGAGLGHILDAWGPDLILLST